MTISRRRRRRRWEGDRFVLVAFLVLAVISAGQILLMLVSPDRAPPGQMDAGAWIAPAPDGPPIGPGGIL